MLMGRKDCCELYKANYKDDLSSTTQHAKPLNNLLGELPHELLLRVLESIDDFSDCASFSHAVDLIMIVNNDCRCSE